MSIIWSKWPVSDKVLCCSSGIAMNFFSGWLEVVLAVVVLALLSGSVSFHRVLKRLMRQDVENHLKIFTELKASQFLSDGMKREA
jgi:hypothetical protein